MSVRTRFAPSPTGNLHIGSARTALYSWLYARKMGGQFILRIEDTDRERSTQEACEAILDAMQWLGLTYDEGPFYQTKHFERYKVVAEHLLETGHAYRCYCSKERLEKLRETQLANKEKPRYDGHCREQNHSEGNGPFVVRFKNPLEGEVVIDDCVRGRIVIQNSELDDLVIVRSDQDATPTYNFTVVVDDWDMKITHVIRGDDHINNTPRQINILKALGAELPIYAHIPMILGSDGKRLSKRHGAVSVQHYREEGILPDALINYLVRLGWSHGDQEIFTREEMIKHFDIHDINRSAAAFNPEKLLWLNQQYIKSGDPTAIAKQLEWHMQQLGLDLSQISANKELPALESVVIALRERVKTLKEMAEKSKFLYEDIKAIEEEIKEQHLTQEAIAYLGVVKEALEKLSDKDWNAASIHETIQKAAEGLGVKLGKIAQPLRVAVTGGTTSPPIDITLELLGRRRTLERLDRLTS